MVKEACNIHRAFHWPYFVRYDASEAGVRNSLFSYFFSTPYVNFSIYFEKCIAGSSLA